MTKYGRHEDRRASDAALLKAAGAHVYSREFIEQYMQAEIAKRPPGLIARRLGESWADTIKLFSSAAAALAGLMAAQLNLIPLLSYAGDGLLLLCAKCALAAGACAAAYASLDRAWCRPSSFWHTYRLEADGAYSGFFGSAFAERSAPEFARSLMRDIRQFLPESEFFIKVLGLDPIVLCVTQSGTYPVLVYDGDRIIREV